ncbi:unnamed protein product [Heterobilharzia americana]|nr:unnamed protein product [Heterobilharzia americana]
MKFDNYSIQCQSYYPYKMPKSIIESSLVEETMPEDHLLIGDNGQVTDNQTVENLCSDEDQTTEGEEVVETPLEDRISTPEPDEWVKVNMEEDAVDLGNYHVVGGIRTRMDYNYLCKTTKLRPFEYVVEEPLKTAEQMASDAKTEAESAIGEMSRKQEKDRKPPVQVKIRLPKCLVIAEDPVLARWDQEKAQWRTSGIQLIEFKENDNIIVFRTSVFGTIAVFQDYHINMPFQCWELRPLPIRICTATSAQNSINAGTMELSAKRVNAPVVTIAGHSTPSVYKSQTEIPKGNVVLASENIRENGLSTISIPEPTKTDVTKDDSLDSNKELMILGPVTTIGLSNEVYLSELPETNQCLLTITGGITDIRLHVLGDRVAILPSVTESGMYTKADTPLTGTTGVSGGGGGGSGTGTASVSTTGDGVNETEQTGTNLLNHTRHELKHLWGKWYTPDELITVLQLSGVNLFPREDSASRIGCINKNPLVEESMYENMALLSPSMAFGWSRWNSECDDSNTIVVTAVEHVDCEDSVDEESWKVYSITRKKVLQLKMKEYDEEYSSEANPSQPFHADFYHMYMDFASEEGKRRVEKIDLKYFKTVKKLLQSTRLLIFS